MMKKTKMNTKTPTRGNPRISEHGIATRFQPGVSGNAGGRPRTRVLAEMLTAIGNERDAATGKLYFQLAAEALLKKAFQGDVQAFKELADRVDGRTTQSVELSGGLPAEPTHSDLEMQWKNATHEQREEMRRESDDRTLALAEKIRSERSKGDIGKRLREFHDRIETGEDPANVLKTLRTPPVGEVD
jgi:hypothetical protein